MIVKTGYGYIKDPKGNIISKYELPIGKHKDPIGYIYHEVNTKKELDAIEIYREPESIEQLAKKTNRDSARAKLIGLGLTNDEASEII